MVGGVFKDKARMGTSVARWKHFSKYTRNIVRLGMVFIVYDGVDAGVWNGLTGFEFVAY